MFLSELSRSDLSELLRGPGVPLRLGPFSIRLGTRLPEIIEPIGLLYADYPLDHDQGIVDFVARVDLVSKIWGRLSGQTSCYVDGQRRFRPFPRRLALPHLEWCINWCVFSRPHQYLILHSAVVERDTRALLLSGPPGAGKSTLSAALMLSGWRLLSDEVALVRPGTRAVLPVPRAIALKDESIEVIRRFDPNAVVGPACEGTRKGTVAHLKPSAESLEQSTVAADPAWLVTLVYERGVPTDLRPVTRAEMLLRLGYNAFNYSTLGVVGFETLADVVENCKCFELHYGDLAEAICAMNGLSLNHSERERDGTPAAESARR